MQVWRRRLHLVKVKYGVPPNVKKKKKTSHKSETRPEGKREQVIHILYVENK